MSTVSDRKVNLVGTLGVKSKKCPIVFKSVRKNPKKTTEILDFSNFYEIYRNRENLQVILKIKNNTKINRRYLKMLPCR
ncbi:Uncharacterized protein FWK35_00000506 [Aphis craccivora]|uniref:Uncharacterized protein n=1 Tax=Aphis craccivora TaxID=307492 RepID=A0A6G0ZLZ3_APHCR|nr:Uncharacterized protein FWK35_00000506 [Aphis craccivora]